MRLILEDAVFSDDPAIQMDLLALFRLAHSGRHRVILATEPCLAYDAWIDGLSQNLRELVETIRRVSLDVESRNPALIGLRITPTSSLARDSSRDTIEPTRAEPSVPLEEALRLLHLPLRVIVEDSINDRAFLIAAARPEDREQLERAEREHWLSFENGGGLPGIDRLFAVNTPGGLDTPLRRLRAFLVYDSDRLAPNAASKRSDKLSEKCTDLGLVQPRRYHQLHRRCIENYLPVQALTRWQQSSKGRNDKPAVVQAWQRLDSPQKHHFNMKAGFLGDQARITAANHGIALCERCGLKLPLIYETLVPADVTTLSKGFDNQVAADFKDQAAWYRQHPSWRHEAGIAEELDELMDALLGAL